MFRVFSLSVCLVLGIAEYSSEILPQDALHRNRRQLQSQGIHCVTTRSTEKRWCPLPGQMENGRYSPNYDIMCPPHISSPACRMEPGTLVPGGWELYFSCDAGYLLNSTDTMSFCMDGQWSPPLPVCTVKQCPPLKSQNMKIRYILQDRAVSGDQHMKPGTVAIPECKNNYRPAYDPGYSNMTCLNSGSWDHDLFYCIPECGASNEVGRLRPLIVDGVEAHVGSFPWHAGLYYREEKDGNVTWVQKCGGSLITDQFVLTAAHCVAHLQETDIRIALGKYFRSWDLHEHSEQRRNVSKILYPPDFSDLTYVFDVALVLLNKKIEIGEFIMPVCHGFLDGFKYIMDKNLFVVGWGRTDAALNGRSSETLLYNDIAMLPPNVCHKQAPSSFPVFDKFCANKNGSGVSVVQPGDSGGGLTAVYDGLHYIFGIVSIRFNEFSYFTNITWPLNMIWLEDGVRKHHSTFSWIGYETTMFHNKSRSCNLPEESPNRKFCSLADGCEDCDKSDRRCFIPPGWEAERVRVVCSPGFRLRDPYRGGGLATCLSGSWYPHIAECIKGERYIGDQQVEPCYPSLSTATRYGVITSTCEGKIMFEHKFDNLDGWTHQISLGGIYPEDELTTFTKNDENIWVQDGSLNIKPTSVGNPFIWFRKYTLPGCTLAHLGEKYCLRREFHGYSNIPPVDSARITTRNKFSFRYGIIEIRAKLLEGDWIVPELWLESTNPAVKEKIVVAVANGNSDNTSNQLAVGVVRDSDKRLSLFNITGSTPWFQDFHTFKLDWTPDRVKFFVDSQEIHTIPTDSFAIFKHEVFISLGVHAGGGRDFPVDMFPDRPWKEDNGDEARYRDFWGNKTSWYPSWKDDSTLQVDYIRVTANVSQPTQPCYSSLSTAISNGDDAHFCQGQIMFEHKLKNLDGFQHQISIGGKNLEDWFTIFTTNKENVFVQEGRLNIKPTLLTEISNDSYVEGGEMTLPGCTLSHLNAQYCKRRAALHKILPPIVSARINTQNSFTFRYGIVEIRAKLPQGDWVVPELWLESTNSSVDERVVIGMAPGNADKSSHQLGVGVVREGDRDPPLASFTGSTPWFEDFHIFKLEWTPDRVQFFVDSQPIHTISNDSFAIFKQEVYISLGVHVGGSRDFPDVTTANKPWQDDDFKGIYRFWGAKNLWYPTWKNYTKLQVDYIRVTSLQAML